MKRVFVAAIAAVVILQASPLGAFAQTAPGALQSQIETLLAQIKSLNEQILNLQQQQTQLQQQKQDTVASILTTLREGDEGEKVRILQTLLASDASIYPEGMITGFYGRLTSAAVRRFQKLHGLEQVGFVGPRTLTKLQELSNKLQLAFASGDADAIEDAAEDLEDGLKDAKKENNKFAKAVKKVMKLCTRIAPGHLIAPGWLAKNDAPTVPFCESLPFGIFKKFPYASSTPTSTPPGTDTTPPVITNITSIPSMNSAIVYWTTNEPADSQVNYGTTSSYGSSTSVNAAKVIYHSQTLTGLQAATVYHFQVISRDAKGNGASSGNQTFTTLAVPDTAAPTISSISATPSSTSAAVSWMTNESADSQVAYGTSTAYGLLTALDTTLVTSHAAQLAGLLPSTLYHYQVRSKDGVGNLATSTDQTFTTLAAPDTTAPFISSVTVTPSSTSATIAWTTNESSTSKVYYGTVNPVDPNATSTLSVSDGTLVSPHSLNLSALATSTTYYFLVESADAAANKATSSGSFATTP